MTEKTAISVPAFPLRSVHYTAEDLMRRAHDFFHVQLNGGKIISSEGSLPFIVDFSSSAKLFCAKEKLFAFDRDDMTIADVFDGYRYACKEEVNRILPHDAADGTREDFAVTDSKIYRIKEGSILECAPFGGACTAVLGERMFVGNKQRVYYSAPLDWTDWNADEEGNYFELPAEGGDIVDAVTFRDKLYLFRERGGITRFTMSGEEFNAKATYFSCACGKIIGGSAAVCGDQIFFLTRNGLYSFDGTSCRRAEHGIFSSMQIKSLSACVAGGKYYACFSEDLQSVCCYDPETGNAHLIAQKVYSIASNGTMFGLSGRDLIRFTESGASPDRDSELWLKEVDFGLPGKEKILESVTVEGEGKITFEAASQQGSVLIEDADCDKRLRVSTVRGTYFKLRIALTDEANLRGIVLGFREVTQ
ncbi:MAG: hypothetical protein ACI4ST_02625 [Candidatus Gallimonas sp.]